MGNLATNRQVRWARKWRDWLLLRLGKACAKCGKQRNLAIDHVDGRDWDVTSVSQAGRVRRYLREYRSGVKLRVLCKKCNGGYNPYRN